MVREENVMPLNLSVPPVKEKYSEMILQVKKVAYKDVEGLHTAEQSYGDSWKQRGGVGAFMMLARKWDRLEKQTKKFKWDIFQAAHEDKRDEGIIDDIRDLRRYLLLVEAEITRMNEHIHGTNNEPDLFEDEANFLEPRDEWKTR